MNDKKQETEGSARDRLREVMIRDRGEMRRDLQRPEEELNRELQETARHAASGELDGGERPARTAREVFADHAEIKALDNDLENKLCLEQEQAQARQDLSPRGRP
jgi:hypothetical protein